MRNISINGDPITLKCQQVYFVIDALYFDAIRGKIEDISEDIELFEKSVREKVFPYTTAPFAKVSFNDVNRQEVLFEIDTIKKVDFPDGNKVEEKAFDTDSGLILFIAEDIILNVYKSFSYDQLVDSLIDEISFTYWDQLVAGYNKTDIGLIYAPGVDAGYDFEGSGSYHIRNSSADGNLS